MRDWRGTTLGERIAYVLDSVAPDKVKARHTGDTRQRGVGQLAELTGLKPGVVSRLGERAEGTPSILRKIADGARVSYVWLSLGEGQPDDPNMWSDTRSLDIAVAALGGVDTVGAAWIKESQKEARKFPDLTPIDWMDRINAELVARQKRVQNALPPAKKARSG